MITAAGAGSGIDIESILSQLGELEREPVNVLNRKRDALDVEVSAYGSVKSALSSFKTAADVLGSDQDFGEFVATSSDEKVFTAVATGDGDVAERQEIEVLQLATNHRMYSTNYGSEEAAVDQGTLQFSSGDNNFNIVIDETNDSLTALRDAINDSIGNTSVSASIINVDDGTFLVLTAKNSGTEGRIGVTRAGTIPLGDQPGGFTQQEEPFDAQLRVHGFDVTSSTNQITDVIDGVTLNLTGLGKSTVNTERNTESLRESLDEFVVQYNAMSSTISKLSDTDLQGDQLPRGIDIRMRDTFFGAIDLGEGDTTNALDLGFTFDRYGTLSIDSTKYNASLEKGVERFVSAFATADTGIASQFSSLAEEYTRAGGVIDTREDGVDVRRASIDNEIDRLEYRIDKTNERLRQQFTSMDLIVTNLQSTSAFLTSRLGNNNNY